MGQIVQCHQVLRSTSLTNKAKSRGSLYGVAGCAQLIFGFRNFAIM